LARRVRAHLDQDHRYAHVVRVARSAELLAQHHALDANTARVAGLLHDLARLYSTDQLVEECARRDIPIGAFERRNPIVLHAPLGAALAREGFGVTDPAVLSAIAKHTLGDAVMSQLDSVLYLADALEPGRDFPERAGLWALARTDLNAAMRGTIENSMRYLQSKGLEPAPQTIACAAAFTDPGEQNHR
jgi:predicted HD superfamily hydrolase involved in NAD metabolism